jgi:hypothetical protein
LLLSTPQWQVSESPTLILSGAGNDDGGRFYLVRGATTINGQRIAVATDATKQIFYFDSTGIAIDQRGRLGRGPGEFQHVSLIGSEDGSRLVAYDGVLQRTTVFGDSDTITTSIAEAASTGQTRPVFRYQNGDLLVVLSGSLPDPTRDGIIRAHESIVRMAASGERLIEYGWFAGADIVLRHGRNGGLTGGEPPFARALLVGAVDSMVVVASTGPFQFDLFNKQGALVRSVRADMKPRRVSPGMITRYRERVLRDIHDDYGVREWTMLSANDVFPKTLPAFDALLTDKSGAVWVRRSVTDEDTAAMWFVFDRSGEPIGRVTLPTNFAVTEVGLSSLVGISQDADRLQAVHVYRYSRGPGAR